MDGAFERSPTRRFDLVIGADGLHSNVRRLAFGPELSFVHHAGLYVATLPLPRSLDPGREMIMLNIPGKCVALHPSRESPLALLIFWHPEMSDFDPADDDQHKRILETTFAGIGWKVPEILKAVRATSDLYFDSVSKVQLTTWTRGRIALTGDASSCVSLFGDGSTLAIAGAHTLATDWRKIRPITTRRFASTKRNTASLSGRSRRTCRCLPRSSCRKRSSASRYAIAPSGSCAFTRR